MFFDLSPETRKQEIPACGYQIYLIDEENSLKIIQHLKSQVYIISKPHRSP